MFLTHPVKPKIIMTLQVSLYSIWSEANCQYRIMCSHTHMHSGRSSPQKARLNKLLQLRGKQTVKPRDVGENVYHPTGRKQVRNQNRKNSASLFSLMRDNKQSNSTTYGGVQAGRCSKWPCHSLPYGVTNCCFSAVTERYTKGDGWREKNTEPERGQKFDGTDDKFCG